jgi:UDP-N-acetylenolpyruvoylglucosamine reductase
MLTNLLRAGGWRGGHLVGGLFGDECTPPGCSGDNGWVVSEIDESDGTIEAIEPEITVCVNVDWDHCDHYPSAGDFEAAFERLFRRTRGPVLISSECAASARIAARMPPGKIFSFGPAGEFALHGWQPAGKGIRLSLAGRFPPGICEVASTGFFNAMNATAALAAARLCGEPHDPGALRAYPGMRRRQSVIADVAGIRVIEDYAHHPSEIRPLMQVLRASTTGRLHVIFQPHRFSRTAAFRAAFASALNPADTLHLLEVYPAGEAPVTGGHSSDLLAEIRSLGRTSPATLHDSHEELIRSLLAGSGPGDLIAFLGAGDIEKAAHAFAGALRTRAEAGNQVAWPELQGRLSTATVLRLNESLASRNTFGIGGPAAAYAEPANEEDLLALREAACARGLPILPLGRGSNLLIPDSGVQALVIRLSAPHFSAFEVRPDGLIRAGAGLRLKQLSGLASAAGLRGFEFLEGIPGTVGGALRMNAGAMGGWMMDLLREVRILGPDGVIRTFSREQLDYTYRDCTSLADSIALEALLQPLGSAATDSLRDTMRGYEARRRESQPREPSAGCMFKNPEGDSAGRLIDTAGLKGLRVGDAEVSSVHANFIVNRGKATASDVIRLVREVRERVRARHGVELEPEVILFGADWREVLR